MIIISILMLSYNQDTTHSIVYLDYSTSAMVVLPLELFGLDGAREGDH